MKISRRFMGVIALLFMIILPCYSQVEVTDASIKAAYSAPTSKLIGTWFSDYETWTFKTNGTATRGSDLEDDGEDFTLYGIPLYAEFNYKYTKKGNNLTLTLIKGNNWINIVPAKGYEGKYRNLPGWQKKMFDETISRMKKEGPSRFTRLRLDYNLNYISNDYLIINNKYIWENKKHYDKRKAQEEAERKAAEKAAAEEARLKAEKEEMERIIKNNWEAACNTNTLESYESFLANYPESAFTSEAQNKITEIKSQQEWDVLQNSNDIEALQKFIATYPDFHLLDTVKSRLYSLEGLAAFNKGDKELAINKFKLVTVASAIPEQAKDANYECQQVIQYRELSSASEPSSLEQYLQAFPQSPYTTEVRNYLAQSLANQFNPSSTQDDYARALSFATGSTVQTVENKIAKNKEHQKILAKQAKKAERKANGGWCGLMLEYGDFTWNGRSEDGLFQYNFGIKFKVGNFTDRIQFALGVKPGVGVWDFKGVYVEGKENNTKRESSSFFEMPIEAELRINLFKTGSSGWCYLDGRYDYNAIRKKEIQTPMGFYAGLGFAGRMMDITFFYGRQLGSIDKKYSELNGLPNPFMNSKNNNYFGLSLSWIIDL